MNKFSFILDNDFQVIESLYDHLYVLSNKRKSRLIAGMFVVAFLVFSGLVFSASGYSFFLSFIFFLPSMIILYTYPWFSWRFACAGYKRRFVKIRKNVCLVDNNIKIKKYNDNQQKISEFDVYEICRIIDTPIYAVLIFQNSAELIMSLNCEKKYVNKLIEELKLINKNIKCVKTVAHTIHYIGVGG